MDTSSGNKVGGDRLRDAQDALNAVSANLDQHYLKSLIIGYELLAAEEQLLTTKAHTLGLDIDGMSHQEIARALFKRGARL